jgi:PAS domain S-box-containing protein
MNADEHEIDGLRAVCKRLRRENEELRQILAWEQRQYVELYEWAPDAYVVTDETGKIQEANRRAEALIGVPRRFLAGKPFSLYFEDAGSFRAALNAAARREILDEREFVLRPRQGEPLDVGVTARAVAADDKIVGIRWLVRDISARKQAETAVRRMNLDLERRVRDRTSALEVAKEAKDELLQELARRARIEREFVTNAAHELRTPVTAITSAIDVLQSGAKDSPEDRDRFLAHIGEQCRRLERLSHALLVLARAEMGQEQPRMEPTRLAPLLQSVAAALPASPEVDVRVRCSPRLTALVNQDLLEQALLNVAGNAAKYVDRGEIELRSSTANGRVVVAISDTGPGMSREDRERAFDRFRRGDSEAGDGFGLGLAIAAQAVEALGGSIEIDSAPGKGTTVRLLLQRPA